VNGIGTNFVRNSKLARYERFNIVESKEQAELIVKNLKARGVKAYYDFRYIVMMEVKE